MSKLMEAARKKRPDAVELLNNNPLRVQIARQLRTARKEAGLTQAQLSAESGMSQPVISGMESPTGPMPEVESMDRFMRACGKKLWLGFETTEEAVQVKQQPAFGKSATARKAFLKRAAARRQGKFKHVAKTTIAFGWTKQLMVSGSPNFVRVAGSERVYAVIGDTAKDQKGAGLLIGTVSPISKTHSEPPALTEAPSRPSGKPKRH